MTAGADLLNTLALVALLRENLGREYDRHTITAWTRREKDPLPLAYQGRPGQSNKYNYDEVLSWLEHEDARVDARIDAQSSDIDEMDWYLARTVEQREKAKQAQMITLSRAGDLGVVSEMEKTAADLGYQAVQMLLNIPSRLAPKLAELSDEIEIDHLLQQEIRAICNTIAKLREEPMRLDAGSKTA